MHRRSFLAGLALALAAGPVFAREALVADIVRQLERRGYTSITVTDTWLGRVRILADGPKGSREIIVNPATGEILRDLKRSGTGGGSDLLDDEDDSETPDDEDDDDKDDDGKEGDGKDGGSSNSGKGSDDDD